MSVINISPQGLGAVFPGVTTINDAWIVVNGVRVPTGTELNAGVQLEIRANVTANNASGGLVNLWSIVVTAIDMNDSNNSTAVKNYADADSNIAVPASRISGNVVLNNLGSNTMPNHDVNLKLKIFGADGLTPSPSYPDIALWRT